MLPRLHKPEMVGVLLEHTVGNLDPLYIVNMVPNGLEIPRLRDRLVKIITDYRTETSLRHGCSDILKADCVNLLVKYYKEAKCAVCLNTTKNHMGFSRIILEGDALTVINKILQPFPSLSRIGNLFEDAKNLIRNFRQMQSSTEANAAAHLLAKSALTIDEDLYWVEDCPY